MTTVTNTRTAADIYSGLNVNTESATSSQAASTDKFLKMLVAQMQNQDPLNPMDNAQMTSQLAQISTVNGVEQLNTTMKSRAGGFGGLETLQAASLPGRSSRVARASAAWCGRFGTEVHRGSGSSGSCGGCVLPSSIRPHRSHEAAEEHGDQSRGRRCGLICRLGVYFVAPVSGASFFNATESGWPAAF